MKNENDKASTTNVQSQRVRAILEPRVSLETGTVNPAQLHTWNADRAFRRIEHFAEVIALAILRNPKVDQLLGRQRRRRARAPQPAPGRRLRAGPRRAPENPRPGPARPR